ncbi:MAG: Jag N-terminal domain-containing protein [Clostridia bacterium]|nr:Jag N-terminal domain-containing protein [Clostridia bacterium]
MRIEATGTGKTIDDAIRAACEKLGRDRDDVEVEVITAPTKKVLGFMGGTNAEVVAFYDDGRPEEVEAEEAPAAAPVIEEPAPEKKEKKLSRRERKEEAAEAAPEESAPAPAPVKSDAPAGSKQERAEAFLAKILPYISSKPVEIKSEQTEDGVRINIEGDDINSIIGRRGETLDALQYLTGIVSAKSGEKHMRVYIDTGSYRARREETLERLAKKYAERVRKTGRSLTLEPMSPNERRIVHMVIQEIDGLESYSKGEGSARRVVIALKR